MSREKMESIQEEKAKAGNKNQDSDTSTGYSSSSTDSSSSDDSSTSTDSSSSGDSSSSSSATSYVKDIKSPETILSDRSRSESNKDSEVSCIKQTESEIRAWKDELERNNYYMDTLSLSETESKEERKANPSVQEMAPPPKVESLPKVKSPKGNSTSQDLTTSAVESPKGTSTNQDATTSANSLSSAEYEIIHESVASHSLTCKPYSSIVSVNSDLHIETDSPYVSSNESSTNVSPSSIVEPNTSYLLGCSSSNEPVEGFSMEINVKKSQCKEPASLLKRGRDGNETATQSTKKAKFTTMPADADALNPVESDKFTSTPADADALNPVESDKFTSTPADADAFNTGDKCSKSDAGEIQSDKSIPADYSADYSGSTSEY